MRINIRGLLRSWWKRWVEPVIADISYEIVVPDRCFVGEWSIINCNIKTMKEALFVLKIIRRKRQDAKIRKVVRY